MHSGERHKYERRESGDERFAGREEKVVEIKTATRTWNGSPSLRPGKLPGIPANAVDPGRAFPFFPLDEGGEGR